MRQYRLYTECDSENENGEKGEASVLDERGHSYAQDPRTREKENNCDRACAEAKRRGDVSEGNETWCDVGDAIGEREVKGISSGSR